MPKLSNWPVAVVIYIEQPNAWILLEPVIEFLCIEAGAALVLASPTIFPEIEIKARAISKNAITVLACNEAEALYQLLYEGALDRFQAILKIYAPSSRPMSVDDFANFVMAHAALSALASTPRHILSALHHLEADPDIGLIAPAATKEYATFLAMNSRLYEEICDLRHRLGLKIGKGLTYYSGRSYWIRPKALDAVRDLNLSGAELAYNNEHHRLALEYSLPSLVMAAGFKVKEVETDEPWKAGRDVGEAFWRTVRPVGEVRGRRVCLFVGMAMDQGFSEPARCYMRALKAVGFTVYALGVISPGRQSAPDPGGDCADAYSIRANEGYDFALWAAALRNNPTLWEADWLLLANDSLIGPLSPLGTLVEQIEASSADVLGLTESRQIREHLQSYFILFKAGAMRHPALRTFWKNVRSLPTKSAVIRAYEATLTRKLRYSGLICEAVFKVPSGSDVNPTIEHWKHLLRIGFPFLKTQVLTENPTGSDFTDWRKLIASAGYDVADAEILSEEQSQISRSIGRSKGESELQFINSKVDEPTFAPSLRQRGLSTAPLRNGLCGKRSLIAL